MIFNIVFFISLTSVLIQGTTLPLVAKWLHLTIPEKAKQRTKTDIELSDGIRSILTEMIVPDGSNITGKPLVDLGLPKTVLISLIQRKGKYIVPNGTTMLEPNDMLYVLSESRDDLKKVYENLDIKDKGPATPDA